MPHRPRRRERPGVIPVTPDAPSAAEDAIDRACHADGESPEATTKRPRVVGLDDQMDMVVLDAEL